MAAALSVRSVFTLIAEPLKHIHAIPAFIILSFARPVQRPTKLFSAFCSTRQTPISPPPSLESTPIATFLLNDCGFSPYDANDICGRKPDLLAHKFYHNSRQTLQFLRDKGFNEINVRKFFSKDPDFLWSSFQGTIKPKVEFLERIGLTGHKLIKALDRGPRLLRLNLSCTLEPRVCFLQSVLDPSLAAVVSNPESDKISGNTVSNYSLTAFVISKNPRILFLPKAKISVRLVKDVEGMGIQKAFPRAYLQMSMLNRGTVKPKVKILRELGFTEEEVGMLVKKAPQLLSYSEDKLRQNLKFLVEEWKLPCNVMLSYLVNLGYSIVKRLKPRLNALRALMMKNKSSEKAMSYPPAHYINMSDAAFLSKVVSRLPVST